MRCPFTTRRVTRVSSLNSLRCRLTGATLATRLSDSGGRPSGFDYLRIGLATSVVLWHTISACYGQQAEMPLWSGWPRPLVFFIVPSFFALSGFLVASSLLRNSIPAFLTLRALRIYPALFCEITISAFLIGPALSVYSLSRYFSDSEFYIYLLNSIGYIHYHLPGVFLDNPTARLVNAQLWTIPWELECYIAITLLALIGFVRRPIWLFAAICAVTAMTMGHDYSGLTITSQPPGRLLVLAFLSGVLLFVWKEKVPANAPIFAAAAVAAWVLLGNKDTATLSALPVAYVTVWLGLCNPRRTLIVAGADYSYGIYLYGFPIQQALAYLLPQYRIWYVNGALSIAVASAVACLS